MLGGFVEFDLNEKVEYCGKLNFYVINMSISYSGGLNDGLF